MFDFKSFTYMVVVKNCYRDLNRGNNDFYVFWELRLWLKLYLSHFTEIIHNINISRIAMWTQMWAPLWLKTLFGTTSSKYIQFRLSILHLQKKKWRKIIYFKKKKNSIKSIGKCYSIFVHVLEYSHLIDII
jgi:hypothetical protein